MTRPDIPTALPVRQRLMAELLRLSRDRCCGNGNGDGNGGERVLSPPPQQDVLARRIGTRRETVSREMAEMARKRRLDRAAARVRWLCL